MSDPRYPDRAVFGYDRSRKDLSRLERLEFDHQYRIAQLPLVAPGHSLAITQDAGFDYVDGVYAAERFSLVAPVSSDELEAAPGYSAFVADVAASSFGVKVCHEMRRRRRDRLHATVAGGLRPAGLDDAVRVVESFMRHCGVIRAQILGPFIGAKNSGRVYLPVIPEIVGGGQAFGELQALIGLPKTGFYAIGLLNFREELDRAETRQLRSVVDRWKDEILLEVEVRRLQIIGTHDDLVLSGRCVADIFSAEIQ